MDYIVFQQMGAAILLASLIGLDREQNHKKNSFGGLRTFALVGLLGALADYLSSVSIAIFVVLTAGFLLFVTLAYFITAKDEGGIGATSDLATVLVYLIGVLCGMDHYVLATSITLTLFLILRFKSSLHDWANKINNHELISTVEFMVIAFVILPLLPNKGFGPYEVFNPYTIWLMVVLISGISFASYIAIKLLGAKRGIGLMGFLGGLISSTALTLSFSAQSKKNPGIIKPYVFAIIIASSAMFFRILILIVVLNRELLGKAVFPVLTMGIIALISALVLWVKRDEQTVEKEMGKNVLKIKSPFRIGPALKLATLFTLILFVARFAVDVMGDRGLYLTSLISGVVDVDPIVVSITNLTSKGLAANVAMVAMTIAVIMNTISKVAIFTVFGNKKVAFKIAQIFLLMMIGGGVAAMFSY